MILMMMDNLNVPEVSAYVVGIVSELECEHLLGHARYKAHAFKQK